jgi:CRP/FNR family transcriptional regulator, cyclic AMP receptor protein
MRGASGNCSDWWKTSTPCPCARGVPSLSDGREVRIGLQLAQEELAQLLGASRQRVNQELKTMEREEVIRIEPGGLVVRNRDALMKIIEADT